MNTLPKPSQEEIELLDYHHEIHHLRDVCRIFKNKVGIQTPANGGIISVLDLGCRNADLAPFFGKMGFNWFGVDKNPEGGMVMLGSMEDIPFPEESFNLVFCSHALEHSENIIQALREMKRVTKCGGMIYIATPLHSYYQIFNCDKTHVLVPTKEQMIRLFEYCGIQPVFVEEWNTEGQAEHFGSLISMGKVVNK